MTGFFNNFVCVAEYRLSMELSVIIPIYNMCSTLRRCLQSVLQQPVDGVEVLLIDDGSTDGSGLLADKLSEAYSMVAVCHKQNGGLSDARNVGLRMAKGRYVTFVDADDEVAPDTYGVLMTLLKGNREIDILEYPVSVHSGHVSEHELVLPDRCWHSAESYWLETEGWEHTYAWNKIYRRELFKHVQFPVGKVFEDMWTIPRLLSMGVRVQTTSLGRYVYQWNPQGITVTANGESLAHLLEAQIRAAQLMHTSFFSYHGWKFYRSMLYRQLDVYRLTGRILLPWPFVKLICSVHQLCS